MLTHSTLTAALKAHLVAITKADSTTLFADVFVGEPLGLPQGWLPYAAVWYEGRADPVEGPTTLDNQMLDELWRIAAWWPTQVERTTLEAFEIQIADAHRDICTRLRGDCTLGGACTDLSIDEEDIGFDLFPRSVNPAGTLPNYRGLSLRVRVKDLEGEVIAA